VSASAYVKPKTANRDRRRFIFAADGGKLRAMRRRLGTTDIDVLAIGLGAMPLSIQGRPDERTATAVIDEFIAGGGNFIDTASSYCLDEHEYGHNERLIAKALLKLDRPDVVVATKGGLRRPEGRWETDGDPQWLRRCCDDSVKNLGGAPIQLYYLHAVDQRVPFAESLGALVRLKDEGKILNIGLSNIGHKHLDEALRITKIAAVQNRCNVFERRDFDSGFIARCRRERLAYVAYSPVGGHSGHRRVPRDPTLLRIARKHRTSPYVVALRWLLDQGDHVLAIPGASKIESVQSSLTATRIVLDAGDRAALDAL
jgi:aryl-alcohol dehydrogenase-like predicted oxidoreductase